MSHEAHAPATETHGGGHADAHGGHPPTTIREYALIGLVLTVITAVELWASYNESLLGVALIPALLVMSAVKFYTVVAMFMHLRFEHGLLTRLFSFGLVLGAAMIITLLALFTFDHTDSVGGVPEVAGAAAPAKH